MPRRELNHKLTVDELARSFVLSWLKAKEGAMTMREIHVYAKHYRNYHHASFLQRHKHLTGDVNYAELSDSDNYDTVEARKVEACEIPVIEQAVADLKKQNRIVLKPEGYYHPKYAPKYRTIDDDWES